MSKIVYGVTGGRAHDLRFVPDDYIPTGGETVIEGDVLPDIKVLHSAAYLAGQKTKEDTKQALKDKHKGKSKSQLTNADVIEWDKLKMAEELGLEF